MPRRKIGADLKEALCKLYEAGDISADTIEKHGIMSRATFFRNLKMYKSGVSLEQRHSTGRKTNADKLKEQERLELDSLQPAYLSHLELVLLLDDDERTSQTLIAKKRKAKTTAGSSKRKETRKGTSGEVHAHDTAGAGVESESDSEADVDDSATLAKRQALEKLAQAARTFLSTSDASNSGTVNLSSSFADLNLLLKPEDSHYSHSNRGALYVVRRKLTSGQVDGSGEIIAAIALRSLIWTPEIYQALGHSYANRSIDKICNLAHLRVDPLWQHKGVGRWLVNAAELKASKLGFSHLYTQSDARRADLLSFWRCMGFNEFARLDSVARLEKLAVAPSTSKSEGSKREDAQPSPSATGKSASTTSGVMMSSQGDDPARAATTPEQQQTDVGFTKLAEGQASLIQSGPSSSVNDQSIALKSAPSIPPFSSPSILAAATPSVLPSNVTPTTSTLEQAGMTSRPIAPQASQSGVASVEESTLSMAMGRPSVTATSGQQESNNALSGPPPRRIAFHEAD